MKRLILFFVLLSLIICLGADARTINVVVGQGGAAATYTDILFYHDFETSLTCGDCNAHYSAGDASPSCQSAAAIDDDSGVDGGNALSIPTSYDRQTYVLNNDDIVHTAGGRVGFYVWVDTYASYDELFAAAYPTSNHVIKIYTKIVSEVNELTFIYIAGGDSSTVTTSGLALTTGAWHFVEYMFNPAGPSFKGYVDGVEVTSDTTNTGTMTKASNGTMEIGDYDGNNSTTVYIDQFFSSNDTTRNLNAIKNLTSAHP
jgi:hypothetical protein